MATLFIFILDNVQPHGRSNCHIADNLIAVASSSGMKWLWSQLAKQVIFFFFFFLRRAQHTSLSRSYSSSAWLTHKYIKAAQHFDEGVKLQRSCKGLLKKKKTQLPPGGGQHGIPCQDEFNGVLRNTRLYNMDKFSTPFFFFLNNNLIKLFSIRILTAYIV